MNKLKRWILGFKFVKQDREEVYRKAFLDASADLKETNVYDVDTKAEALAKKKLNDLLSPVDLTSIVRLEKQMRGNKVIGNLVYIGGILADEGRLGNIKAEVDFLTQSEIWRLLTETPKELAQRAMFVDGDSLDTMKKGRGILYTLSTQKNIVDVFKSYYKN